MPFCAALTNHLNLDVDRRFRPCCVFRMTPDALSAGELSWTEYRNSKFYQELKNIMSTDQWHSGCTACKINEDLGLKSQRHDRNFKMSGKGDKIEFIDLFIDRHCNLSCKTCGPWLSSSWQKIVEKNKFISFLKPDNKNNIDRPVLEILEDLDLSHLKKVKIQGGEPFLSKNFKPALDLILQKSKAEHLLIITNSTFFPKNYIPLMEKFPKIDILLSIDGLDDVNKYIRHGSNWNRVESTAMKYQQLQSEKQNFHIAVNFTLCGLNLHQYIDVKKWCRDLNFDFYLNLLKYPDELSINSLPESYIQHLLQQKKLDDITIMKLIQNRNTTNNTKLKNYLRQLDLAQKTDLKKILPDLYFHLNI